MTTVPNIQTLSTLKIDIKEFQQNLLLTQKYCDGQLEFDNKVNGSILRSINPIYNSQNIFSYSANKNKSTDNDNRVRLNWNLDPHGDRNDNLIADLFDKQLIEKVNAVGHDKTIENFSGEILVSEIDCTLIDGASEDVSGGLIDCYDCPPIDTWFYLATIKERRILFAWIPQQFLEDAENAIQVNCVNCIHWLKEWEPEEYPNPIRNIPLKSDSFWSWLVDIIRGKR